MEPTGNDELVHFLLLAIYAYLEYHLGKTRHGSLISLMTSALKTTPKDIGGKSMNAELKALMGLAFDLIQLGEDAFAKKNFMAMMSDVYAVVQDVPAVIQNLPDLAAELQALPNAQNSADLAGYIQTRVASAGAPEKTQKVLAAALKLVQDGVSDVSDLIMVMKS